MSREKQIDEMARTLKEYTVKEHIMASYIILENYAEHLYNAGYRKEIQGEWLEHVEKPCWLEDDVEVYYKCSVCGATHWSIEAPYCPNCGAHMKGAE